MRFSEPDECRRALTAASFGKIIVERLDIAWMSDRPEALLDLIAGGTVRAAMMIEAQDPSRQVKIRDAIVEAARSRDVCKCDHHSSAHGNGLGREGP